MILLDLKSDLHVKFGLAPLFDGEKLFFVFEIPGDKAQGFARATFEKLTHIVFFERELFSLKRDDFRRIFVTHDFT